LDPDLGKGLFVVEDRDPSIVKSRVMSTHKEVSVMQETSRDIVWRNMENELKALCEKAGGTPGETPSGVCGYALLDLTSGKRAGFHEDILFVTASTIKIAVLLGLATRVHRGELSWEQRLLIGTEGKVGGSGVLSLLRHPVEISLWDLAGLMICVSDNHATNLCIDFAGMDDVNQLLDGLGLHRVRLRRKMMDAEAAKRGDENVATPGELVDLLEKLYRADGIPAPVASDVLTLMELPKSGPFARAIPESIRRANKTGGLVRVQVDAGIVYLPDLPFCLAVMGSFLPKNESNAEDAVTSIVRCAYRHMELMAECNELGRTQVF
jgi:beta-lactamase class A